MNKVKIGINGFGRIGRITSRIILNSNKIELTAINSRADSSSHAYLLQYDSNYGTFDIPINYGKDYLEVKEQKIAVLNYERPSEIPWDKNGVDIVIDSTGKFRKDKDLEGHLKGSVKYVVLSAPAKDNLKTIVMGVNQGTFAKGKDKI